MIKLNWLVCDSVVKDSGCFCFFSTKCLYEGDRERVCLFVKVATTQGGREVKQTERRRV